MERKNLVNLALLFKRVHTFLKNLEIEDPAKAAQLAIAKEAMGDILTIIYTDPDPFECSGPPLRISPPL
jgi:hypothetical protein